MIGCEHSYPQPFLNALYRAKKYCTHSLLRIAMSLRICILNTRQMNTSINNVIIITIMILLMQSLVLVMCKELYIQCHLIVSTILCTR